MALNPGIKDSITLPAVCAPMFLVSTPALVREACKAGVIGGLPRQNARSFEQFELWLGEITDALDEYRSAHPQARVGPIAVNLVTSFDAAEATKHLDLCARYGVKIIITAVGNPTEMTKRAHDVGAVLYHDVTTLRHAEKAIAAGVDGLTCIGAGGGGHSGTLSHLALVPRIRTMFDGTIVLAGAVTTGAAIRAAEILGADLAYLGTRFIATKESGAAEEYKQLLVGQNATGLRYTPAVSGLPANWLVESLSRLGVDIDTLVAPRTHSTDHLPDGVTPWKNVWSAGQGIELIDDIPPVAELVRRLRTQYVAACATPDMADIARLVDQADAHAAKL